MILRDYIETVQLYKVQRRIGRLNWCNLRFEETKLELFNSTKFNDESVTFIAVIYETKRLFKSGKVIDESVIRIVVICELHQTSTVHLRISRSFSGYYEH